MRWRFLSLAIALCALTIAAGSTAGYAQQGMDDSAIEPLAVVLRWTGTPRLVRQDTAVPLATGARLLAGDRIEIPDGSSLALVHRTGRLETLRAHTTLTPAVDAATVGLFAHTASTLAAVASIDARSIVNREGFIRPLPGTAVPIAPVLDIRVLELRPVLSWFAVPEATGYLLQLRADGGPPVRFEVTADTVWQPAEDLLPGTRYEWTVAAMPAGRPGPVQAFRTATDAERIRLRSALAELAGLGLAPEGDGLLLAALIHRELGFLYATDAMLQRLEERGAQGPDFFHLRASVRASLGDEQGAALFLRRSTAGL